MKKLFLILGSVFLASTVVMTILFMKQHSKYQISIGLFTSCVESMYNATDLYLCTSDYIFGNVGIQRCDQYLTSMADDMELIKEYFPRTDEGYYYIGE